MVQTQKILKCRGCGKLYPHHVPAVCDRCQLLLVMPDGKRTLGTEMVPAKKQFLQWKETAERVNSDD